METYIKNSDDITYMSELTPHLLFIHKFRYFLKT